jgi:hypothetical protein
VLLISVATQNISLDQFKFQIWRSIFKPIYFRREILQGRIRYANNNWRVIDKLLFLVQVMFSDMKSSETSRCWFEILESASNVKFTLSIAHKANKGKLHDKSIYIIIIYSTFLDTSVANKTGYLENCCTTEVIKTTGLL